MSTILFPLLRRTRNKCEIRSFFRSSFENITSLHNWDNKQLDQYNVAKQFSDKELKQNADYWDEHSLFPLSTFKKFASLGFGGMLVSADIGGSSLNRLESVAVVEALAAGCVSTTAMLTIHNACANMVDKFGTKEQRNDWAAKLTSMDLIGSFCLTEPGSGSDAGSIVTRAVLDPVNNEYVINGGKAFISGAGMSDLYMVMCRTNDTLGAGGISCIVVPKGTAGLSFGQNENKVGWKNQPTRQISFENVRVPATNLLGAEGAGFRIAMSGLDGGRLNIAACSLGAAQNCFEIACTHIMETKPQDQNAQFILADMAGKITASRLCIRHSAALLDSKHPAATVHCALAKKLATDYGFEVCNDALQLLGRHGILKGSRVERHVRDVRVHQILEGTNEIMRHIIGRALVA